jgi:hypothetical protein
MYYYILLFKYFKSVSAIIHQFLLPNILIFFLGSKKNTQLVKQHGQEASLQL